MLLSLFIKLNRWQIINVFGVMLPKTLLALLMLIFTFTANADQIFLTPQELVKVSDVAVTGTLTLQQDIILANKQIVHVGVIDIEQVYKGVEFGQKNILIELAPYSRVLKSTDVTIKTESEGLWLLKKHANGLYRIERPDALLPKEIAVKLFSQ